MRNKIVISILCILGSMATHAQIGKCKGKYLGNIIQYSVPGTYNSLWNQTTSENGSKWASIEGTKGTYNWTNSDLAYNWAKNNGGMFKYHTFVWGSQTPGWVSSASTADIQASIQNLIIAAANHYDPMGGLSIIDVLNEPVNTAMPGNMKAALTAGYQAEPANAGDLNNQYGWAIWPFQLARKYFPNATLLINEYNVEMNWNTCRTPYIAIANAIKNAPNLTDGTKNLIDGVGLQCHGIGSLTAANFKACIDEIWNSTGLPVHITEFDQAADADEAKQQTVYSTLIPVAWEHAHVAGITLWGYIQGTTWINGNATLGPTGTDSGIIYGSGYATNPLGDRPAMTWLRQYFASQVDLACCPAPAPFANCATGMSPTITLTSPIDLATYNSPATVSLSATAADADGTVTSVDFYNGTTLIGTVTTSPYTFSWTNVAAGNYTIKAVATDNSGNKTTSSTVTIRVSANAVNGTIIINAKGVVGTEIINLEIDGVVIQTWTITTAFANYTASGNLNGVIRVNYTNDDGNTRDAAVDYITVGNTTYQAEDQAINTAYYANGSCGGGGYSQLMHCNGYIEFVTTPITVIPNPPTVSTPVNYCQNASATALSATGTALKWYTVEAGGTGSSTAPTPVITIAGSTSYYVSQTVNGIESNRAVITVNVNAIPTAPSVTTPVSYKLNETATALTATGANLLWYTGASGGIGSASAPTPSTASVGTTSYYVSQTVNNCESSRSQIDVIVSYQTVSLKAGWNIIGCPINGSTSIAGALSSIWQYVISVKNSDFYYYYDNLPVFNTLTELNWGEGYLIKVSADCELDWIVR